ncbi:MAG: haloacid dehalogenase [Acidimicrobiales bacterium]|nr:haloacid dehalogenase [Acidimicrobiales bacterium]
MSDGLPVASDVHTIIFDFDGVFTDNKVWVDQNGREWVRCDRADGLAIDLLRTACRRGLLEADVFILSTETNPVVRERAAKLRLTCHQGVLDKLAFVEECLATRFPDSVDPFSGVVFLGNDLNDLPLLRRVGWAVVPADAHPRVRAAVGVVFPERGGESFVRRFVERMLGIDDMAEEEINEYLSDR